MLPEQNRPAEHALPQAPQLAPSDTRLTHPAVQATRLPVHWQRPLAQDCPSAHFTPHMPQF